MPIQNLLTDLLGDIHKPEIVWQAGIIVVCVAAGWLLARLLRANGTGVVQVGVTNFGHVLTPALIAVLSAISRLVAKPFLGNVNLLKGGGRLVYATCSLLNEENDFIVEQFLAAHPEFDLVPMREVLAEQKIDLDMGDYLKLLPHKHQTDGFFAAVMQRKPIEKKAPREPLADDAGSDSAAE